MNNGYGTMNEFRVSPLKPSSKRDFINGRKKLLQEKETEIKKLETQKADLAAKGRTLDEDDEKKLRRLYNIVRDIKDTINRETERLDSHMY